MQSLRVVSWSALLIFLLAGCTANPNAPATTAPTTHASATGTATTKASSSPSPTASTKPSAKVDKSATFVVYNGSVSRVSKLAAKANQALAAVGFTKGQSSTGLPVSPSRTTKIYYGKSADKATANAIKAALGVGAVSLDPQVAANGIVVVVAHRPSALASVAMGPRIVNRILLVLRGVGTCYGSSTETRLTTESLSR